MAVAEPVNIARCPEHGVHGQRDDCHVCGGPVEQVAMVPLVAAVDDAHDEACEIHLVRMGMSVDDAERLSALLLRCPADVAERVHDQLWLRTIVAEQRRRAPIAEREAFDTRADRLLELLDPPADRVSP